MIIIKSYDSITTKLLDGLVIMAKRHQREKSRWLLYLIPRSQTWAVCAKTPILTTRSHLTLNGKYNPPTKVLLFLQ